MPIIVDQIELQTHRDCTALRLSNIESTGYGSGFRCDLTVRSGGFECQRPFYFEEEFLTDAINALRFMITGTLVKAIIRSYYEKDFLRFEVNQLGHVVVSGELHECSELSQSLKFAFWTDQTVLRPLLNDLVALDDAAKQV